MHADPMPKCRSVLHSVACFCVSTILWPVLALSQPSPRRGAPRKEEKRRTSGTNLGTQFILVRFLIVSCLSETACIIQDGIDASLSENSSLTLRSIRKTKMWDERMYEYSMINYLVGRREGRVCAAVPRPGT